MSEPHQVRPPSTESWTDLYRKVAMLRQALEQSHKALVKAHGYVKGTHANLAGAVGTENVVYPDLLQVEAAMNECVRALDFDERNFVDAVGTVAVRDNADRVFWVVNPEKETPAIFCGATRAGWVIDALPILENLRIQGDLDKCLVVSCTQSTFWVARARNVWKALTGSGGA